MKILADVLSLEPLADGRFRAGTPHGEERRIFGGQLIAQAVVAAARTTDKAHCNSLHAYFVAAGDLKRPLILDVARVRDGRSFAARQVEVTQEDRLVFSAALSFHGGDPGPAHQVDMPDVPAPETLEDQREVRRRNAAAKGGTGKAFSAEQMIDARPVEQPVGRERGIEGRRCLWFRSRAPLGEDAVLHQAAIAYASDMGLVHVGLRPHMELGDGAPLDTASLDHAIWFHRPARADQWLLHVERSPIAADGRGLSFGTIYTRDGELVASVAQEILVRWKAGG
ncbi:MAG: acyl-CoA thioesterase [Allosphingosinicella sp.]|uniref:acyl-CoA thioesterase n=1 Tax=Allosphingosinicella sp. TaxID=2823234 RepID=UPI00394B335F